MDGHRFDAIVRSLTTGGVSRRGITRTLAALGLTGALSPLVGLATAYAKKKKRKKKKKVTFNDFGCVNVGSFCKDDGQCCSGTCQGKKPKKGKKDKRRCAAHNVLDCPAGADYCGGTQMQCGTGETGGSCVQTTGQASFCSRASTCGVCSKDVDCEPVYGAGAACMVCASLCPSTGTGCVEAAS